MVEGREVEVVVVDVDAVEGLELVDVVEEDVVEDHVVDEEDEDAVDEGDVDAVDADAMNPHRSFGAVFRTEGPG